VLSIIEYQTYTNRLKFIVWLFKVKYQHLNQFMA